MDSVDLSGFKNTQWAQCHSEELRRADTTLNTEYRSIQSRLVSTERREALVRAQRAWLAYRDSFCAFAEMSDQAPNHETNNLRCLVDLTHLQTAALIEAF
jgi:uncharacterized protein YecT (DUF1311 family)